MRLEIQNYLKTSPPEALADAFGIYAKRHSQFPNLVMFKYGITARMDERIVQECRGIILDESNDWSIVSRPYDKFFNSGEGHASPIDWSSAIVYEKLDGSLMCLYFYAGEWRVSSSGVPDASGPVEGSSQTFAELFWRVWRKLEYVLPSNHGLTYLFELMTPYNRVVVPHSVERIVLHGAREIATGKEFRPSDVAEQGWEVVKSFPLTSVDACLTAAESLPPLQCEGYVVCDNHFNRVKIKSPKYVALAHAKEGFNGRAFLELVRKGEGSEFLSYFPELRPDYDKAQEKFSAVLREAHETYASIRHISSQKEFAAEALKSRLSPILFAMRNKGITPEKFLADGTIYAVERMVFGTNESGVAE